MKYLIVFFPWLLFAQQKITIIAIDNRLEKSNALLFEGQTDNMIKLNLSILEDSKQINYPKGKIYACYNLALAFSMQYRYNKSNHYLKLMESEFKNLDDEDEEISMNLLYSMNYKGIKMYDEALEKLRKNLVLAKNIKTDSTRYSSNVMTLVEMAKNHVEKKSYDSATYYCKRVIEEVTKPRKMDQGLNTSLKITLLILAETKLKENKIDSAEFYVKSAQSVPIVLGNNEFRTFKLLGEINREKKQYDLAIVDYKKAIELAAKVKNIKKLLELYGLISEAYKKIGQTDNEKKYMLKYNTLSDSLKTIENENLKDTVGLLVEEKQKPLEDKNNLLLYIIFIGITGSIIIIFLVNNRIRKKDKILNIKEQETKVLTQKLNIAFDQVIQLAKKNDPEFMTRFQEVYPNFFPRLLQIEPQLQNSELKFCALLFLNFSSKDIAAYTFVQPRSIQIRKNRLRKRLNISSEEDLYIWMKNINNN
jgi:tetratricopeptide (TPR) repeat protein